MPGKACRTEAAGFWWAAVDKGEWPDDQQQCEEIVKLWKKPWGDRRQELVVIGQNMDHGVITAKFDACLLTDEARHEEEVINLRRAHREAVESLEAQPPGNS